MIHVYHQRTGTAVLTTVHWHCVLLCQYKKDLEYIVHSCVRHSICAGECQPSLRCSDAVSFMAYLMKNWWLPYMSVESWCEPTPVWAQLVLLSWHLKINYTSILYRPAWSQSQLPVVEVLFYAWNSESKCKWLIHTNFLFEWVLLLGQGVYLGL